MMIIPPDIAATLDAATARKMAELYTEAAKTLRRVADRREARDRSTRTAEQEIDRLSRGIFRADTPAATRAVWLKRLEKLDRQTARKMRDRIIARYAAKGWTNQQIAESIGGVSASRVGRIVRQGVAR